MILDPNLPVSKPLAIDAPRRVVTPYLPGRARALLLTVSLAVTRSPSAAAQDEETPLDMDAPGQGDTPHQPQDKDVAELAQAAESGDADPAPKADTPQADPVLLAWYGSLESDLGFARYDAESSENTKGRVLFDPIELLKWLRCVGVFDVGVHEDGTRLRVEDYPKLNQKRADLILRSEH